ncbi:VanZ family protein [Streptomyces sp. 6N223]|uniref:VanZ family protein n=1 Tax=Streptomyces sp. 6N223 TaxID=3457412 RepID=UPI003FD21A51
MRQHPAGSAEPSRPAHRERGGPGHDVRVHPRVRVAALLLLAAYLAFVAWQSLRPLSVLWVSPANLEPFDTISSDIRQGPEAALRTIGSGLLRLAPLGVLLPLLGRRLGGSRFVSLGRTVSAGGMIALLIEWIQSLVPSRVADVDTIILNTVGIALTHLIAYGGLRALTLNDRSSPTAALGSRDAAAPARAHRKHSGRNGANGGQGGNHGGGAGGGLGGGTVASRDRAAPHGMRGAALSR